VGPVLAVVLVAAMMEVVVAPHPPHRHREARMRSVSSRFYTSLWFAYKTFANPWLPALSTRLMVDIDFESAGMRGRDRYYENSANRLINISTKNENKINVNEMKSTLEGRGEREINTNRNRLM
jgi:hypothetical protein